MDSNTDDVIQLTIEPSWVEFTVDKIRFTNERKDLFLEYEGDYMNPMPETITFILKGETFKYVKIGLNPKDV